MFLSKLCKSSRNCAWNLAFPVFISPIVWNVCYESNGYISKSYSLHWKTIYRAGTAVVSTITSSIYHLLALLRYIVKYVYKSMLNKRWNTPYLWYIVVLLPQERFFEWFWRILSSPFTVSIIRNSKWRTQNSSKSPKKPLLRQQDDSIPQVRDISTFIYHWFICILNDML